MNWEKAYKILFNAITAACDELDKSDWLSAQALSAIAILKDAQLQTEDLYVEAPDIFPFS